MNESSRRAAWGIYLALHHLASGVLVGQLETSLEPDGSLFEGDLDYARRILIEDGPTLAATEPQLAARVRGILDSWENGDSHRFTALLGALRDLEQLTGSSIPLPLPPGL